jgi:hypothetical protein
MRIRTVLCVIPLGAALCATPAHAGATDLPAGRKCAFNSSTDVTREAGWQVGDVNAGPLVTGAAGTLVCSIHVNNATHSGLAVVTETVDAVGAVAVMAPRPVEYRATAADDVVLCTRWVPVSGPTLYWTPGDPLALNLGRWSTDPNALCLTYEEGPNDPECSIWLAVDQRLGTDIAGVWQDCEGYEPII